MTDKPFATDNTMPAYSFPFDNGPGYKVDPEAPGPDVIGGFPAILPNGNWNTPFAKEKYLREAKNFGRLSETEVRELTSIWREYLDSMMDWEITG